ncbi:MAG: hypothetical protein BWK76_28705 [Desulfobulbaceae bacterium A2]|nr:MAG: hypothetical protein BWK76_28705 [Desulfobulbaceae bacterium A2]
MVVYRRYPGKILRDSYTPQILKLQIVLLFALFPATFLRLAWPHGAMMLLPTLLLLGYGITVIPFTRIAFKCDFVVGLCAPLLLALRAAALGAGALAGLWGGRCR